MCFGYLKRERHGVHGDVAMYGSVVIVVVSVLLLLSLVLIVNNNEYF